MVEESDEEYEEYSEDEPVDKSIKEVQTKATNKENAITEWEWWGFRKREIKSELNQCELLEIITHFKM